MAVCVVIWLCVQHTQKRTGRVTCIWYIHLCLYAYTYILCELSCQYSVLRRHLFQLVGAC